MKKKSVFILKKMLQFNKSALGEIPDKKSSPTRNAKLISISSFSVKPLSMHLTMWRFPQSFAYNYTCEPYHFGALCTCSQLKDVSPERHT